MNVYSDSSHTALKYLKDTEVNLLNLLIMAGNFNIRDSFWDPAFPHHSYLCDDLLIVADSFNLELSYPTNNVPTRYLDSDSGSNSTIDLMFLRSSSRELNSYFIIPNLWLSLNHALLTVMIGITEENIDFFKFSIVKNSEEESRFIEEVSHAIKSINADNLVNSFKLEEVTKSLASRINHAWKINSKWIKITKRSKSWWNKECNNTLNTFQSLRSWENWKSFKHKVKAMKQSFFDTKIQEIVNKRWGPWKLMNWVNKKKLPAIKTIKYNNWQCLDINNLWCALHSTFNIANNHQVDTTILDEISSKSIISWLEFLREEFKLVSSNYNNSSAPGLDKLSWNYLKIIFENKECLDNFI